MKTNARNLNGPGLLLLALFILALVAACSGGNIDVAIGGVNIPPGSLPPFPNSEAISAEGTVTGLGDLTVNGVRFDARDASVLIDSNPGTLADLKLGHVVSLSGRINSALPIGQASTIRMQSRIIGPVESADAANRRLLVMGQTVRLGPDTYYPPDIDPTTLAGLTAGSRVRISGYSDAAGAIRATRVEAADTNSPLQVIGEVSGLNIGNLVFDINQLVVDYSSALLIDLPSGAPSNGMTVKVIGRLSHQLFVVEQLLSVPSLTGNYGQRVQLGGIITRFPSVLDFAVHDTVVTMNSATTFIGGDAADLQLNAEVMVDGMLVGGGKVRAERICFGQLANRTTTLQYDIGGFTSISVPTVFGISVEQGAEYSVAVIIDEEAAHRVQVTRDGSNLTLALQPGNGVLETIDARVTMPVLDRIDLTGVVSAKLHGFDQADMTINVGNVSNLSGDAMHIGHLRATVSGVSQMDLGNIRPISRAEIAVSGVSNAVVNMDVGSRLGGYVSTGQGTGASALFYYGSDVVLDVAVGNNASLTWLGETRP